MSSPACAPARWRNEVEICLITPTRPGALHGNHVTALRWQRILGELGHRVEVTQHFENQACHLLVALHARRSHDEIVRFHDRHPEAPLVVVLTGTDLYGDLRTSTAAQRSMKLAWRLVVLQPLGLHELPEHLRPRARVIYQSVPPIPREPGPVAGRFDVLVLSHLREVKDPLRTAEAARLLPADSRVHVIHLGSAIDAHLADRARAEAADNARYEWRGPVPRSQALDALARSRLLVLSSLAEGGANVVSEAIAAGVPVIASRIPGSVGLLGEDYPGYYPAADTASLSHLLHRAETDAGFYGELERRVVALRPLVDPARERDSWNSLLAELKVGVRE